MRNTIRTIIWALIVLILFILAASVVNGQKARPATATVAATQQPLFSEYKGTRLGMTTEQVRAKLGEPTSKRDDQDYYVFSNTESAQFVYDATHKVITISVDYTGGEIPDYRNVVGPSIDQMTDGALYKLVRYEAQGFWVSYNRTAGTPPIVTITIQKILM